MKATGSKSIGIRTLIFAAFVAFALIAVVGCGSGGSDSSGNSSAASSSETAAGSNKPLEGKTVQYLSCPESNTFCSVNNNYVKDELEKEGAEVTVQEANFDPVEQAQQFEQAIATEPDLILVQAADPKALIPSLHKAQQAEIPVINTIGRMEPEGYELLAASVECDCAALGRQAAQNVVAGMEAEGLKKGNVVAITGTQSQYISQDRIAAFEEELAKTPQFKLVAVEDGNWADSESAEIYRQLSAKYASQGGIQAAWGMADNQANAIIQAAKQLGQPVGVAENGLIVVGTSCQPVTVKNLANGDQYAGSTNSPLTEAKPLVKVSTEYLEGDEIPPITRAEENVVNKENIGEYSAECNFSA